MSSRRLVLLAIGLPLLVTACGAPLAVTAVSYGADGVSLAETGKSTGDHLISMVSKQDCAVWRVIQHQKICNPREDGHDPYDVNYDQAMPMPSEDGVSYAPPLRAKADAPAASWTADTYKTSDAPPAPAAATPVTATEPAAVTSPPPTADSKAPANKPAKKKVVAKNVKKPSPGREASVP